MNAHAIDAAALENICNANGYPFFEIKNGNATAIAPFIFTWGILSGVDRTGYRCRYCYGSLAEAFGAFNAWDGRGDPAGFITKK